MSEIAQARARQLAATLSTPARRVRLEVLREAHRRLWPEHDGTTTSRHDLASLLNAGADVGLWALPSSAGRAWDRSARPPLPTFVTRDDGRPRALPGPSPSKALLAEVFVPRLAWAYDLGRLTTSQLEDLRAVNQWLAADGASAPIVPREERSLEVFGDEKHIAARLAKPTEVWGPSRLDEETLRCRPSWAPLPHVALQDRGTLLIAENRATFWSLTSVLRDRCGPVAAVGWGMGNQLASLLPSVTELPLRIDRILYFGDVDGDGLAIALAGTAAAAALGLPALQAAVPLYELLIPHASTAPDDSAALITGAGIEWLPATIRPWAQQLALERRRAAQEAVGYQVLTSSDQWVTLL